MSDLRNWFGTTNGLFKSFKRNCLDYHNHKKRRIFIDRNSKVLLVAHADTVHKAKYLGRKNNTIYARGLDDRLGCWAAWKLSHELKTDLLITDLEESAKSTAKFHQCNGYNWIAEFDRNGDDAVFYGLGSVEFKKALKKYFHLGWGSFSDIVFLKTEVACVNIGIGYHGDHSLDSWANLVETKQQMRQFRLFYHKHKNTSFVKDYKEKTYSIYSYGQHYTDSYDDLNYNYCDMCNKLFSLTQLKEEIVDDDDWLLCRDCYRVLIPNKNFDDNEEITCNHCYELVSKDAKVCPFCYNYLEQQSTTNSDNLEEDEDNETSVIINPYV